MPSSTPAIPVLPLVHASRPTPAPIAIKNHDSPRSGGCENPACRCGVGSPVSLLGREAPMSTRTIFLARLIGLFAILLSLSEFLHKQATVETAAALVRDRPLLFILAMLGLLAGLAMVLAHNVWSGDALPIVVTLFGWILLIRGALLLFLSPEAVAGLIDFFHFEQLFYLYAGITLVLGLYLTYAGFKASPPSQ